MTESVTIDKIFINERSKAGVPFKNNDVMVSITDMQGRKMSTFVRSSHPLTKFQKGQTFNADITEKNGFLNFALAGGAYADIKPQYEGPAYGVESQIDRLERLVKEIHQKLLGNFQEDAGDPEITQEIPF